MRVQKTHTFDGLVQALQGVCSGLRDIGPTQTILADGIQKCLDNIDLEPSTRDGFFESLYALMVLRREAMQMLRNPVFGRRVNRLAETFVFKNIRCREVVQ